MYTKCYLKTTQKDFIQSEIVNDIQDLTEGPFFGITDMSN